MKISNITGGIGTYPPGATFGPRTIPDHEFVYVHAGTIRWSIEGFDEIVLPPESLLHLPPGTRDSVLWDETSFSKHSYCHFSVEDADGLPDVVDWPTHIYAPAEGLTEQLMLQIVHLCHSGREDSPLTASAVHHLLMCFIFEEAETANVDALQLPEPVERAFGKVADLWSSGVYMQVPVSELADASGVTETHLSRLFQSSFDMSPAEAIRKIRMIRAAQYLSRSNLRVQEIASILGCDNPFHFSRSFRAVHGVSPKQYREQALAGQFYPPPKHCLQLLRYVEAGMDEA